MVLEGGAMAQFSTAQSRIEIYWVKSTHNLIRSWLLQQARSTESLEINGLRKVIRFCHSVRVCERPGVLIGSNRSLRENDATCNCGPAAFCKDLLKTK